MSTKRLIVMIMVFISIILPSSAQAGGAKTTWVNSYTKKDGTHVRGHWRSSPSPSLGGGYVSPYAGSSCYMPDYSKNENGYLIGYQANMTKEGLDLSRCILGRNGGAGLCEGFKITVADGIVPEDLEIRHHSLSQYCQKSYITNLPGGASVVCNRDRGGGIYSWVLAISPQPVCTDGNESIALPEKSQVALEKITPIMTDLPSKEEPITPAQQESDVNNDVTNDIKNEEVVIPARHHSPLYATIPAIVFLTLLALNL
jgi:hypothetical protein